MNHFIDRRSFLKTVGIAFAALNTSCSNFPKTTNKKPNIILCMADDLGWGDTGYNGHPVLKTPNLDEMSREGIRFDRFYAAAPVCSPTRGSCLTGRNPFRYGIYGANKGHLKKEEITLAEVLKTRGYTNGHFGKWHLGTLDKNYSGKGDKREPENNYSPPDVNGFDEWFSTEFAVATWDPYDPANTHLSKKMDYDTRALYWHNGQNIQKELKGDDSRIIMDKAIPFIQTAVKNEKPFLAVIWFHAPHIPVVAGPTYRAMYADQGESKQHYFGCITALDEQMGRLRQELKKMGIEQNTMLWFASDNGPAGKGGGGIQKPGGRQQGSAGPFRGRKGSLYEGGIRVPGMLVWPEKIKEPRVAKMSCCSSDYYPTVLDVLGINVPEQPQPIDGISLLPLIDGKMTERPRPIGFQFNKMRCLTDHRYKIISMDNGQTYELYDLIDDPSETTDLAGEKSELVQRMTQKLELWIDSCKHSDEGKDYK